MNRPVVLDSILLLTAKLSEVWLQPSWNHRTGRGIQPNQRRKYEIILIHARNYCRKQLV